MEIYDNGRSARAHIDEQMATFRLRKFLQGEKLRHRTYADFSIVAMEKSQDKTSCGKKGIQDTPILMRRIPSYTPKVIIRTSRKKRQVVSHDLYRRSSLSRCYRGEVKQLTNETLQMVTM